MSTTFKSATSSNFVPKSTDKQTIATEGATKKVLSFLRSESERFLYINYPETITPTTNCYANNNLENNHKRIFQTTINANETVHLFFSHHNRSGGNINYAILIWNPNSSTTTATVKATNSGYAFGWNIAEFAPWVDFYNGKSITKNVKGQTSEFLLDWKNIQNADNGEPFSGVMRITSNYAVILTVYMWKGTDIGVIDGNEEQYAYNRYESENAYDKYPAQKYTGIGAGYFNRVTNTITTNEIGTNGVYYMLARNDSGNTNEMIPITLSGASGLVAKVNGGTNLENLGNWGAQYEFTTTLDNSSGTTSKVFKAYIGRGDGEAKVVIRYGSNTGYCSMGDIYSTAGEETYKWNFLDVNVPAYSKETVTFQLVHATCSAAPLYLQWK